MHTDNRNKTIELLSQVYFGSPGMRVRFEQPGRVMY